MRFYAALLIALFLNSNPGSATEYEDPEYHSELKNFNRGFITQVLSNPLGGVNNGFDCLKKLKFISDFRDEFLKDKLKRFPREIGVNDFDAAGMAPMHYLAMMGIEKFEDYNAIKEIANILISFGADINLPNKYGITPLRLAVSCGNYPIVEVMLATKKLKKDLEIFKVIFSDTQDSRWQEDRHALISGRIQIFQSLQEVWLENIEFEKLLNIQNKIIKINDQLLCIVLNSSIPNPTINNAWQIVENKLQKIQCILLEIINDLENKQTPFMEWVKLQQAGLKD